jgi:hypothetical protein
MNFNRFPQVAFCGYMALLTGCSTPPQGSAMLAMTGTSVCTAEPTERRPLVLPDGTEAYVEPMNLMRVGSDFVVVGAPTYTWEVGSPRVQMATDGAYLAAYLDEDSPRLIEKPIDVPVGIVRSIPLDDHRWGALFSEADPEAFSQLSVAVALWYAEYDGERWSEVEQLPIPEDRGLFVGSSSPLASLDGGIGWVVVTGNGGSVLHYERRDGAWRFEVVEDHGMEAAALASGPSGAWLALSGVDPALPVWTKSVRLYRWDGRWQFDRRVATVERYTQIRDISVAVLPGGVTLTWREVSEQGSRAMARVGLGTDAPGTLVSVDPKAEQAKPVATTAGVPAWVVHHTNDVPGSAELRFVRFNEGRADLIWTIPYPYTGYYAALATGPDEVLVTGSEFDPDPARPTVRSLTLRLSTTCH